MTKTTPRLFYVKITTFSLLFVASVLTIFLSLTVNTFVDDVLTSSYQYMTQLDDSSLGSRLLSIMADGYFTIVSNDYLIPTFLVSSVMAYVSAYLTVATVKGYPLRSVFTKNYWYQFDFGLAYRPFNRKKTQSSTKKPG